MPALLLPSQVYQEKLNAGEVLRDCRQEVVLASFDQLHKRLEQRGSRLVDKCRFICGKSSFVKGIYLWGSVGIGKTFLMDCFFSSLSTKRKKRIHFHAFMEQVQEDLNKSQGYKNPLSFVAKRIYKKFDVLCFDEFFVKDITDAMVFVGLLKELFHLGVCFVATSNVPPDDLYKHGLQRQNFLPVISWLKENTEVIHLDSVVDYRVQHFQSAGVYYTPLTAQSNHHMQKSFELYSKGIVTNKSLVILGREIEVICRSGNAVWFDFTKICGVPRSQRDYLELSKRFKVVLVSNIPVIKTNENDLITCLVNLVDIFYDAGIKLIISAEKPLQQLYTQGKMKFDFGRTESRLTEMQSADYFFFQANDE